MSCDSATLRVTPDDMRESVKDNEDLPKYIVGMLRLDYFDDAVGQVEGFQIFGDIMQHGNVPMVHYDPYVLICLTQPI
jgi:hypothetical protein